MSILALPDDFIEVKIDVTEVKEDEMFPASMFEAADDGVEVAGDVEKTTDLLKVMCLLLSM